MTSAQQLRERVLCELKREFWRFTDDPRNSGSNPADAPTIRLLSDVVDFLKPLCREANATTDEAEATL